MGRTTTSVATRSLAPTTLADVEGERFETTARLVVAPSAGIFEPTQDFNAGSAITAGQVVGHLTAGATRTPVVSPFAGQTGAPLAWPGERMISHQPVMWLSTGVGAP